jgi:hypothetical protein
LISMGPPSPSCLESSKGSFETTTSSSSLESGKSKLEASTIDESTGASPDKSERESFTSTPIIDILSSTWVVDDNSCPIIESPSSTCVIDDKEEMDDFLDLDIELESTPSGRLVAFSAKLSGSPIPDSEEDDEEKEDFLDLGMIFSGESRISLGSMN